MKVNTTKSDEDEKWKRPKKKLSSWNNEITGTREKNRWQVEFPICSVNRQSTAVLPRSFSSSSAMEEMVEMVKWRQAKTSNSSFLAFTLPLDTSSCVISLKFFHDNVSTIESSAMKNTLTLLCVVLWLFAPDSPTQFAAWMLQWLCSCDKKKEREKNVCLTSSHAERRNVKRFGLCDNTAVRSQTISAAVVEFAIVLSGMKSDWSEAKGRGRRLCGDGKVHEMFTFYVNLRMFLSTSNDEI